MIILYFATALLVLSGCAVPISHSAKSIIDVNVIDVQELKEKNCENLGDLEATSGWGNAMAAVGIRSAKNTIRNEAAKLGATHVVWTNQSGGFVSFVHGRAYRCPQNTQR